MIDREAYRHGSARWANADDVRRAGLFKKHGLPIGYFEGRLMRLDSDASGLICAGAGAGKGRDLLIEMIIRSAGERLWMLDPRGEQAAVTMANFLYHSARVAAFNPKRLHCTTHGVPANRINPLDVLRTGPSLVDDAGFIAEGLISLSSGDSRYFEIRARQWLVALLVYIVEVEGSVSFPALMRVLALIEGDVKVWKAFADGMHNSRYPVCSTTAAEMWAKQANSEREFGGILGTIYGALSFMASPELASWLEDPDFSLEELCTSPRPISFFLIVPSEYLGVWSPLLRVMFTVSMIYKGRNPSAPRLTMILDECGQLGRFEAIMRAVTFGRGAGIRAVLVFQDVGQIARNFDENAVQTLMGSCPWRTFFGIRDLKTAQMVSAMCGHETLEFTDEAKSEEARRRRDEAMRRYMEDDDIGAAFEHAHFERASQFRSKMQRLLLSVDEALSLGSEEQITFISGLDLPPMRAQKRAYFSLLDPQVRGRWLQNPYHGANDRVKLPRRWPWSKRWHRVITEPAPGEIIGAFPQIQDGAVRYVEGFKPF